ncbi:MAG: carboxypeptidase regulatory-like domain-containing protein [Planctomycetes bacterium]|nr:carboxypeptidase regulatory-like domain-containing protein [Planctomycetota bacterium]
MRLWPFLKLAIPLGTLAALAIGYAVQRATLQPDPPIDIQRPPPATFAKLEPPVHGHRLAGRVSAPSGEALDRALVWVRSGDEGSFTRTDAQGAFGFDDLGPGPWPAKIVALGFEPLDLTLEDTGKLTQIALAKAYGPPPTLARVEHEPLAGQLELPAGFDASDCEVVLEPEAPTSIDSALPRRARCDAQGAFHFDDLIAAKYLVRVLPAWARGGSWPDLVAGVAGKASHEFTHAKGAQLAVQLELGSIQGTLAEASGAPVEGALAELALASDPGRIWIPQSTDAQGHFRLHPLPHGAYVLTLRAGGATLVRQVELGPGEQREVPLRLEPPAGER